MRPIVLETDARTRAELLDLDEVFVQHPGRTPVDLIIVRPGYTVHLATNVRVNDTERFRRDLERLGD